MNPVLDLPIDTDLTGVEIAIVGMAGRFPGAADLDDFWRRLRDGVESVTTFSDEELRSRGVPEAWLSDPLFVKSGVVLDGVDQFDAGLFGYAPREAAQLDPQHRVFLECAWEALEHAGYGAGRPAAVGVYAGDGPNLYLMQHLLPANGMAGDIADLLGLMSGNSAGALCTRVAYKLNLRGPAVTVQTECSTSLVAVHMACQALLSNECDMALAGGVWLNLMQGRGYRHQPGAILSPDGHCRAFDARAAGTIIGSGCGVVALKRLDDALRDGDTVLAVVKGSAANNDGSDKIGFTAPSIGGQAAVIRAAQTIADVEPRSIGLIEAHGTGTTLGDPIEISALTQAFRAGTKEQGFCAIGSVKTNLGHLDAAAGVAGLIKAVLALRHGTLPPSLHFETPNPQIDFAGSPFFVNTEARPWTRGDTPRRAGVSSFGIGGTNVHVVLEEAPPALPAPVASGSDPSWQVLPLSALSTRAVQQAGDRLAAWIDTLPAGAAPALADVAWTLQTGRQPFEERRAIVADASAGLADAARTWRNPAAVLSGRAAERPPEVVFLLPGTGTQHLGMGRWLHESDREFRADVDSCCERLRPLLGLALRDLVFASADADATAQETLARIDIAQPALFIIEYALARWWMRQGVQPALMLGHSLGEYVAACLAGVFERDDALRLVVERGRLLKALPPGAMTAITLPPDALGDSLETGCDLAAVNAEQVCVLSGPVAAIEAAEQRLAARGHVARRLRVTTASHSAMTEPAMAQMQALVASVPRRAPRIPFVSNVTGQVIDAAMAQDPAYWAQHLRSTVRFADGLSTVLAKPGRVLLDVGPGETLAGLARQHPAAGSAASIVSGQAAPNQPQANERQAAVAQASLWVAGVALNWRAVQRVEQGGSIRRRVPLPGYAFQRRRHWVDAVASAAVQKPSQPFYAPTWQRSEFPAMPWAASGAVLVLGEVGSMAARLAQALRRRGRVVLWAECGADWKRTAADQWTLRSDDRAGLARVLREAEAAHGPLGTIVHGWALGAHALPHDAAMSGACFSVMALAQALDDAGVGQAARRVDVAVLASGVADVSGTEPITPELAMLAGPARVMTQELPGVACRVYDVLTPPAESAAESALIERILDDAPAAGPDIVVAYRGPHRWTQRYDNVLAAQPTGARLRRGGVYLITGGLGGVGLAIARHLAEHWQAKLVLLGRRALPQKAEWAALIAAPDTPALLKDQLRQLIAIEATGAEVLTLQADVSDAASIGRAVADARQRFGTVHGVVHAAGDAGGGVLAQRSAAQIDAVLAPKVRGTRHLLDALDTAFGPQALDFVLLCSSIASVAGGLGLSDYAAANLYLDGVAAQRRREGGSPVISVNWDAWRDLGMARGMQVPEGIGMDGPEGARAFERIVNGTTGPQVVVTTVGIERLQAPIDDRLLDELDEHAPAGATTAERHPRPALAAAFRAPRNDLERALAVLWSERLGIEPIGVDDSLFELGGDSLVAIQLLSRVRKAHGLDIAPSTFFKTPTIAALSAVAPDAGAGQTRIELIPRGGALPLSPMQRRLWLVDRLTDPADTMARAAYNMSAALALTGPLDRTALVAAVNAVVARHEALRTWFDEDEHGEPRAHAAPSLTIDVPVVDLGAWPQAERELRFAQRFDAFMREPFTLGRGPLIRAELVRLDDGQHRLSLAVHHIVCDGWSIAVFAQELGACYAAARRADAAPLPALPLQYADYAAWYERSLSGPERDEAENFWQRQLEAVPALSTLPADRPRPAVASHRGAAIAQRIEPALAQDLDRLARDTGTTLFHVLLTSFFLYVHQATSARDVIVGTDVAGRRHPDLEGLIGFFVNVLPLRSRLAGTVPSFREALRGTAAHALDALDHQSLPFDRIVELAGLPRARDRNPLVQLLFVLQNTPEVRFHIDGVDVEVLPQQLNESKFDLAVFVRQEAAGLSIDWAYATDLFDRETVQRHADGWRSSLAGWATAPDRPIDTLPTMSDTSTLAKPGAKERKLDKLSLLTGRKTPTAAPPATAAVVSVPGVRLRPLVSGQVFPLLVEPAQPGLDPLAWAREHAADVEALLTRHAGLLFRGFDLPTPQAFESFAEAIEPELFGSYGDLPKKEGGRNTYRSTPYPEREMILFHNESAHLERWPRKQWFYCELPSPVGGATPIVDCRRMLTELPAELVDTFERKGLLYVRTFVPGLDVAWREFFKTDRRDVVESHLAAAGIAWHWFDADTLQMRTRCPAVIRHPVTGERVFFNQVQLHHTSCLDPEVREDLLDTVGPDKLPRQVCYGDGTPIDDETMAIVGRAYEACAVRFEWQQGDVVMLDNMLAAHARDPFEGPRKIVVAMGAMCDRASLDTKAQGGAA